MAQKTRKRNVPPPPPPQRQRPMPQGSAQPPAMNLPPQIRIAPNQVAELQQRINELQQAKQAAQQCADGIFATVSHYLGVPAELLVQRYAIRDPRNGLELLQQEEAPGAPPPIPEPLQQPKEVIGVPPTISEPKGKTEPEAAVGGEPPVDGQQEPSV